MNFPFLLGLYQFYCHIRHHWKGIVYDLLHDSEESRLQSVYKYCSDTYKYVIGLNIYGYLVLQQLKVSIFNFYKRQRPSINKLLCQPKINIHGVDSTFIYLNLKIKSNIISKKLSLLAMARKSASCISHSHFHSVSINSHINIILINVYSSKLQVRNLIIKNIKIIKFNLYEHLGHIV